MVRKNIFRKLENRIDQLDQYDEKNAIELFDIAVNMVLEHPQKHFNALNLMNRKPKVPGLKSC
jgi:hypothetical protein